MKTLKLEKDWSYVTPEVTIDYPKGEHEVTNEIHAAAVEAGATKEDKTDGGGASKAGATGAADMAKG